MTKAEILQSLPAAWIAEDEALESLQSRVDAI